MYVLLRSEIALFGVIVALFLHIMLISTVSIVEAKSERGIVTRRPSSAIGEPMFELVFYACAYAMLHL